MNSPHAIVDLGTNTFKLLVCDRADGGLRVIHREELPVYLGRGGIEQGMIAAEAMERGMAALRSFRATALSHGLHTLQGFGTSALRNARNADAFVQRAKAELDIDISIIPGEEEAALILDGVRQAVTLDETPALIMDIGGGSTEFIIATADAMHWKRSFEVGVTRLLERFPVKDPMTGAEEAPITQHLTAHLGPLRDALDRYKPNLLIGSAGSFDTLAAMIAAQQREILSPERTSIRFTLEAFVELKDRLMCMDRSARLQVPGLPEHRVDTIPYALLQIAHVLEVGGMPALAWSRYALKEGAAARMIAT